MVLMGMSDDDRLELAAQLLDEIDVGQDEIDARQLRSRKGHAAIDHDPLPVLGGAIAVECEVHADFANAAER